VVWSGKLMLASSGQSSLVPGPSEPMTIFFCLTPLTDVSWRSVR
jgi:hypothetical protein